MRAYVGVSPSELELFFNAGSFSALRAVIVDLQGGEGIGSISAEQEELEFQCSWEAAIESRENQENPDAIALVLAVDLEEEQIGQIQGNRVKILSALSWSQVESLLVADSQEQELSWFAAQEISSYLPQWLT